MWKLTKNTDGTKTLSIDLYVHENWALAIGVLIALASILIFSRGCGAQTPGKPAQSVESCRVPDIKHACPAACTQGCYAVGIPHTTVNTEKLLAQAVPDKPKPKEHKNELDTAAERKAKGYHLITGLPGRDSTGVVCFSGQCERQGRAYCDEQHLRDGDQETCEYHTFEHHYTFPYPKESLMLTKTGGETVIKAVGMDCEVGELTRMGDLGREQGEDNIYFVKPFIVSIVCHDASQMVTH